MNFAIITVGTMAGSAIAPPLFGAIIEAGSAKMTFFVISTFTLFASLITFVVVSRYTSQTPSIDVPILESNR
jgi:fucose permease